MPPIQNNVAVVFDLDKDPRVSISDTSKTKVDNMECLNAPEREKIPLLLIDYLQAIQKLKTALSKKKKTPSLSEKTNIDFFQLDVLYALDKEKLSDSYTLSNKIILNVTINSCKHDKLSKTRSIRALLPETTSNLIIFVDPAVKLADLYINQLQLLPIPNTYTITNSYTFCATSNIQAAWILICADVSTSLNKSILAQANHLKAQVFHYDSCRDGCTDSTQESLCTLQ